MYKVYKTEFADRPLEVEIGRVAELASGACIVKYGDTVILATATGSKDPRDNIDFFPLSVDYEERLYAVGKIPGGFIKREGRPSEKAILTSRAIDRPLRPLFPKDFRNDVEVQIIVMSVEQDNLPEIAGMIGASIAVSISDIPFNGPTASVFVGLVDNKIIINPNEAQRAKSTLNLTVAGTKNKIAMIEAGADQVPDNIMLEAIIEGHKEIQKMCAFIQKIVDEIGKPKMEYKSFEINQELYNEIYELIHDKMYDGIQAVDKQIRDQNMSLIKKEITEIYQVKENYNDIKKEISEILYQIEKKLVRKMIYQEHKRPDNRKLDEIRPLSCEIDILPRTHGSAIFKRGQTQVMSIATLGAMGDVQTLDGIDTEEYKRYMHHYNFPGFSVGEAKPVRAPGRREVGHGALAERALEPVIPDQEQFPYAIRVVSEVLSSNGSTSQASICGSTLALMDAGVPLKAPVAGISTGLITDPEDDSKYVMITDIQGLEDFFGDMDFKVAGTKQGITAIQVDIKVDGLSYEIIKEAFNKTKIAREYILDEVMLKVINKPNEEVSKYAPKIYSTKISKDKIRDVIGPGGKMINKIIEETGVKIDIEEDGKVFVYGFNQENSEKAIKMIEAIGKDVEIGQIYMGKIVKVLQFGAIVEFAGGKDGMVHISKLSEERVNDINTICKVGDEILVKVMEIEDSGRISLSHKDALQKE